MRTRISETDNSPDILTPSSAPKRGNDSVKRPRQGWEDAFQTMAARGDDELLDGNLLYHAYDEDEW
jgi:hypothetical protein